MRNKQFQNHNLKENARKQRLTSIDALRGFNMFWITGGQKIVAALSVVTGLPAFQWFHEQMRHVPWNGFAFIDMIFPLFLFLSGVSMPFSMQKRIEKGEPKKSLYKHAFIRMIVLIVLGLVYNRNLDFDFENARYASVLGRIGIAWFFAVLIYLNFSLRKRLIWFSGLLITYFLLMLYVPVPNVGAGVLTLEGNLAGYIDRQILPGRLYLEVMDPGGILSTIPAVGTALLGTFGGSILNLSDSSVSKRKKVIWLLLCGVILLIIGILWDPFFPINKNLWTSSFVLFAGGISFILLALFYLVIDVLKFKKWAFFFVVIGMNPITIYIVQNRLIDFNFMRDFLFTGVITIFPEDFQILVAAVTYVLCVWGFLYFLFRYRIFLKV